MQIVLAIRHATVLEKLLSLSKITATCCKMKNPVFKIIRLVNIEGEGWFVLVYGINFILYVTLITALANSFWIIKLIKYLWHKRLVTN